MHHCLSIADLNVIFYSFFSGRRVQASGIFSGSDEIFSGCENKPERSSHLKQRSIQIDFTFFVFLDGLAFLKFT